MNILRNLNCRKMDKKRQNHIAKMSLTMIFNGKKFFEIWNLGCCIIYWVKSSELGVFSGPYFPVLVMVFKVIKWALQAIHAFKID